MYEISRAVGLAVANADEPISQEQEYLIDSFCEERKSRKTRRPPRRDGCGCVVASPSVELGYSSSMNQPSSRDKPCTSLRIDVNLFYHFLALPPAHWAEIDAIRLHSPPHRL